ncbi:MAG TPA: iron-sulfur cluster assembly scaffold protein [Candidatus Absconditabacterales bacterium]|nr:iron-sulfur cluster assembly scaffold protein [Candidatus Absconditabacterales bacterium]
MGLFGSEKNMIINEYSKNPLNNFEMEDFTVQYHEGNFICGDDITVFLKIEDEKIKLFSYTGNLSIVSLASASFISEFIIDSDIHEVLKRNYDFISDKGLEVSNRRKRAVVLPILAVRNAIHNYLGDGITDDFDDLLDD